MLDDLHYELIPEDFEEVEDESDGTRISTAKQDTENQPARRPQAFRSLIPIRSSSL